MTSTLWATLTSPLSALSRSDDLHVLAAAGRVAAAERGEDRDGRVQAREHVDDRDADLRRRPVGLAGDAHQPGLGLDDEVVAGPAGGLAVAEAGDRAVDEPRVHRPQLLEPDPERFRAAGAEVLDDDVGGRGQPQERRARQLAVEVERGAPLPAVDREEVGRLALDERRAPGARLVADARPLDLHHLRAEVGEHHRAVRPGEDAGEVEHAEPVQRKLAHLLRLSHAAVEAPRSQDVYRGGMAVSLPSPPATKPLLRGVLHQAAFPVSLVVGALLIIGADGAGGHAAAAVSPARWPPASA